MLRVIVCGEKITSENISNKLLEYFEEEGELDNVRTRTPELAFNPRPYYTEVLCKAGLDDDHRVLIQKETSLANLKHWEELLFTHGNLAV